jgi:hypothetical protein
VQRAGFWNCAQTHTVDCLLDGILATCIELAGQPLTVSNDEAKNLGTHVMTRVRQVARNGSRDGELSFDVSNLGPSRRARPSLQPHLLNLSIHHERSIERSAEIHSTMLKYASCQKECWSIGQDGDCTKEVAGMSFRFPVLYLSTALWIATARKAESAVLRYL